MSLAIRSRLVFISGQEPEDEHGDLVGADDMAAQAMPVCKNLGSALAAIDARPDQVAKITIYVVDYARDDLPVIEAARAALFGSHEPADSRVGVSRLSKPGFLIGVEVEAVAVLA